jgi:hypothetical protein
MKKFYAFLALAIVSLLTPAVVSAQTTLAPGDLYFTGYNSLPTLSNDNFSFVLLVNVTAGTQISFTDKGWYIDGPGVEGFLSNALAPGDGSVVWTAPAAGVSCGTEIRIMCEWTNALSATVGTVAAGITASGAPNDAGQSGNNIELGGAGDQLFAFQGTIGAPTLIAGFDGNGAWAAVTSASATSINSAQPTVLGGTYAPTLLPEQDNYKYNCPTAATSGTKATLFTNLTTGGNWISQNATDYALPTGCTWSVTDCTPLCLDAISPTFTTCLGNQTVLVGAGCATTVPDYAAATVATDNVGVTFKGHVNCTFPSCPTVNRAMPGASLTLGSTLTVSVVARDACGNEGTCTFNVTGVSPEINLQGNGASIADGDATPSLTDHTDFGSQSVCSGTIVRTFTIQNSPGTAPLNIGAGGITITGTDAALFTLGGITLPTTVATSGSTTFTVTFDPNTTGLKTATINIANDDCNEAVYDFAIQGTGVDPEINLVGNAVPIIDGDVSPTLGDHTEFASVSVCSGTVVRTYTIENTGNANLTLAAGAITLSGTDASMFAIGGITLPATVAGGSSTTFTVTFDPSSTGLKTATVNIANNDCNENPYNFAIQGTGIDPEINLQGNSVTIVDGDVTPSLTDHTDFGSQSVCSGTVVRTYTIQNTGSSSLLLGPGSITITGTDASMFTFGGLLLGASIGPGTSMTFTVTFNPSSIGMKTATVNLVSNDCDETTYNFNVQGTGIDPEMDVLGNSLSIADNDLTPSLPDHTDFGNVNVSSNLVRTYTISNTGSDNLTIGAGAITLSGTDAAMFAVGGITLPITIGAGSSTTFTVTFTPASAGLKSASVNIANNDCDEAAYNYNIQGTGVALVEVNVQGNATTIVDGDVTPSATDHTDFGSVLACTGTIVRTFTIQNTGGASLTVGTPTITGAGAADFSLTAAPAASVAPAGSTTFQITFNPSVVGLRTATVSFTNSDADENPYDFAIQGTGNDDFVSPTITACPSSQNVIVSSGCNAILPDYTSLVTATDNCGIAGYFQLAPNTPGTSFGLGSTITVTVVGRDAIGNEGTCTFNATAVGSDINLRGNATNIVDGDLTPTLTDHTDFGSVAVAGNVVRTFTIQNTGTANLTLGAGAITMSGTHAAMFTVGGITLPTTIVSAGSTTFTVTFTPTSAGLKTATVNIANNDCNESPYDFAVQGTGDLTDLFVDITATGANNGTSWANAFTDLQNALAVASAFDTVFVAQGTYKPDLASPGNRNLSFNMKSDVVVLGGFPTGGGTLASRNWTAFPTNLSGDIGVPSNPADNSYHVVRSPSVSGELNGFVVSGGNANGAAPDNDGGGIFITSGYTLVKNCTFATNIATDQGGGSYHDSGGNPTYRECAFASNSAANGGGSYMGASTIVTNCLYNSNTANIGGGLYALVNINMFNLTFKSNTSTSAGNAIHSQSGGSTKLYNSVVWDNSGSATQINAVGAINIQNSIVQGGCPGGAATCTSVLNVDPLYADVTGRLLAASPAIDAGNNSTGDGTSDGLTIDLDGLNRNFDAIPGGSTRDMGAFEFQSLAMFAEMDVRGNLVSIADGDASPSSSDNTDFGSVAACVGTLSKTFVIHNLGTSNLTLSGLPLVPGGTHAADFTVTVQPSATVAAGGSTSFTVVFDPSATGVRSATLSISNDDGDENPYNFSIQGTGGASPTLIYVDETASGANDGTSWANAYTSFQSALSSTCLDAGDSVLVAKGTYIPSSGSTLRRRTFNLVEGVKYFGGFPNGGGAWSTRNFTTNRTILSGDQGIVGDSLDNCFVVVNASNLTNATRMSGFTVEKGNADSTGSHIYAQAGGINLGATGEMRLDSLTIRNNFGRAGAAVYAGEPVAWTVTGCDFTNNRNGCAVMIGGNASGTFSGCTFTSNEGSNGGAILQNVLTGTFTFTNCTFTSNRATASGGGGAINAGNSANTFTNCTFTSNQALTGPGGALYKFYSTLNTFNDCDFVSNTAGSMGGGALCSSQGGFAINRCEFRQNSVSGSSVHGGAIYNNGNTSSITNSLFWSNTTTVGLGGAVYNNTGGTMTYSQCTFANNNAGGFTQGGAINNNSTSNATLTNCILWGNTANGSDAASNTEIGHGSGTLTTTFTIWQGNSTGGTIYNANPLFTNASIGDLTLNVCSPAIDTGTASAMPAMDLLGNARPFDAKPGGLTFDLGAYELQSSAVDVTPPTAICQNVTVNLNAAGTGSTTASAINNGSSDNCTAAGSLGLSLSTSSFTCANVGANPVTLTVTDATGNTATCNATVTVTDPVPPTALCANLTTYLNASGTSTIVAASINAGSTDACGIGSLSLSTSSFDCSDANVGRLVVSDLNSMDMFETSSALVRSYLSTSSNSMAMAYVPSKDSIYFSDINARAIKRVHVNGGAVTTILSGIDPFGIDVDIANGHIYYADFVADHIRRISMGGTGATTIVSGTANTDYSRMLKLDLVNGKIYFTDANQGTIKRCNLNGTGLTTLVTGMGNIVGLGLDVPNNKMYYSSYSFSQIRRANLDGTGVTTLLSGLNVPLGLSLDLNAGKIYHAEGSGNKVSVCNLDGTGNTAIITSGLSQPYDLFLIPPVPTTLTVTDVNGNSSTCVGYVTVRDTVKPIATCRNITAFLNSGGTVTIAENAVDNGSTDACGISTYDTDVTTFTCANVGANTVTLTVTDVNGNSRTCTSTVTVGDSVKPIAVCQNINSYLNSSGSSTITGAAINGGSSDACGIATLSASPSAFTCANVGANTVTLTVTDVNGNSRTCTSTVTVLDTVKPVANCQNITAQLNAAGSVTVTGAMVNAGSTDACGIATLSASPSAFTCANVGANTVTLTVTDVNGNSKTCTSTVTVLDTVKPVANCQNITSHLNAAGTSTVSGAMINAGSTDACGIATLSASPSTFSCANVGANTVTLTVTDVNGNSKTCTSTVTVLDTVKPVANCQNITSHLNGAGTATVTGAMINAGSTDACGIATLSASPGALTCANVGANTVTLTVTDVNGNSKTCTSTVTVIDTVKPVANCQNITSHLNAAGTTTVTGAMINAGSTDACGIATLSASPSTFTCANVGANTVTLTVTDVNGNSKTCTSTVTVLDTVKPVANCQNITSHLNAAGTSTVTGAMINAGSTDACGIATLSASPSAFTCANVGANTVTLTVTDVNGNSRTCTSTVTVLDTVKPVANCQNITSHLNAAGSVTVTGAMINAGSTDACGIASLSASPSTLGCANVGANTVTLTVTDVNGNSQTCTSTVTVLDTVKPVANCQNINSFLNAGGSSTITASAVNAGSTDACGIATLSASPSAFTCANVGAKTVTLTVTDVNGNSRTCTSTVTVLDTVKPIASCQNITSHLNAAGTSTVTGAMINAGSTDACGIATLSASPSTFGCANVGANTVTLTVTDVNGNSRTCTSTVTVLDTVKPIASCQNITSHLNAAGTSTISGAMINAGSTDACGIATLSATPSTFSCANVGANTVTLTVTDVNGNSRTCTSTVTVMDTVRPIANCQNITAQLNAAGSVTVTGAMINNASTDACGIATLSASPGSFTCANVGANTVVLTVTDVNGNTQTCSSTVTVMDTVRPVANCQNITAQLNAAGSVTVTGAMINAGSTDACGIATLSASPGSFSCANVGANTVVLTVTDVNGNSRTCTSTVTVMDTVRPVANCQNITSHLNAAGTSTISGAMINAGSTDACGIATLSASPSTFTCANVGANTVTLTVTDVNGNSSICTSTVTVMDTVRPVALCQNVTAYLNASGSAVVGPGLIDAGSSDACGISVMVATPALFSCASVGANTVTLDVTDVNGNTSSCLSTVTILDTVKPVANCQNITAQLNAAGSVTVSGAMINSGSTDACGIATLSASPSTFGCANVGANTVTLTVTDVNGNSHTCTSTVTVMDTVRPVANCQNITSHLNASGTSSVTGAMINAGSTDACGIATLSASPSTFTCANVGANTVTLTVTDVNGNSRTCTSTVTVLDTVRPVANCQNITVQLNNAGVATVTGAMINNASTDACGIATLSASPGSFSCANVGANTVVLTVTDVNGNNRTCTSTVTVMDTVRPVANCQNITAQLNAAGSTTVTGAMINGGSSDACGIASLSASPSSFTCANVGANTVTLTVTDVNGNSRTCTSTVTVQDTVRPVANCQNISSYLNAAGASTITGALLNAGSTDACGIASLVPSVSTFGCANVGANTVTLTVTDVNGNSRTCTSTVTVLDTVRPVASCQNINSYLNAAGTSTISGTMLNAGSTDACGIASFVPSVSTFSCANVGPNTVVLTVTDVNGNLQTCTSTVTVVDSVDPVAVCQPLNVYLNPAGAATIGESAINSGSSDACGGLTFDTDVTSFTCGELGPNTLVLTVTDANGNSSTCSAVVTVLDTVKPVILVTPTDLFLDSLGLVTLLPSGIDAGSNDACGIDSLWVSTATFDCADLGSQTVWLIGSDGSGNTDSAMVVIAVHDTIMPWELPLFTPDIHLDASGNAIITPMMVLDSVWDNCGAPVVTILNDSVTCGELGSYDVMVEVADASGNVFSDTLNVTVVDTVDPVMTCAPVTLQLPAIGIMAIDAMLLDGGSLDNCGIDSFWTDLDSVSCADFGPVAVTLFAVDGSGNIGSCVSTVMVVDTLDVTLPALDLGPNVYDCAGDAVLTPGTGYSSYLWTDGSTNDTLLVTSQGTYGVTVWNSNGCFASDSVVVFDYVLGDSLISTVGPTVVCSADTLLLKGPIGYVSYVWNTGATTRDITTSTGGWYSLFAEDSAGCRHLDSIWVQQFAAPDPNPVINPNGNVVACAGETVTLDAGGGYAFYWWNTGETTQFITGAAPSTYWVIVENGFGCRDSSAAVTINPGAPVVASISYVSPTLFASPTGAGFTYQWYFNGSVIVGAVNSTHVPTASGDYSVVITNEDGCEGSDTLNINIVGVDQGQLTGIEVFPNPSRGEVTIRPIGPIDYPVTVRVTDMLGQVVKEYTMAHLVDDEELDLTKVSAGVYQLELTCELGVYSVKLVVQ